MEGFLTIVGVIAFFTWRIWVPMIFGAGVSTAKAAGRAATGKGSFSENMNLEFKGMGEFTARLIDGKLGDKNDAPDIKSIELKGLFPITVKRDVAFITSIFDITDGIKERKPILSSIDMFQEPESIVFQHQVDFGEMAPNYGYPSWSKISGVIPDTLQTPIGGTRKLEILLRLVDVNNMPNISHGFYDPKGPKALWTTRLEFSYTFEGKGYEEEAEDRDHSRSLSVKVGMAVAMADGSLDDSEGEVLKSFVKKSIAPFADDKKDYLKGIYNDAMKVAHTAAKNGDLSLSELTTELNEIADMSSKYETIELCFDVMAADGVADAEELKIIRKVADALELDYDEIEKMRDRKLVGLETNLGEQANIEDILGIESDWSQAQIKQHLLTEFTKWNNRLNALSEGDERNNAQQMLDLVAEAHKKYD
jgi:tellurite resistance protein